MTDHRQVALALLRQRGRYLTDREAEFLTKVIYEAELSPSALAVLAAIRARLERRATMPTRRLSGGGDDDHVSR
jgi:hypothetical protein